MDWSLVLVSQGIETTIDYSENGDGWGLLVATGSGTQRANSKRGDSDKFWEFLLSGSR